MFKNKRKLFVDLLIFGVLIILAIGIYNFLLLPDIRLKGSRFIELDYLEEYNELGYSASFLQDDVTDKVKVTSNVNSKKLGNYEIIYSININGFKRKAVRKVRVTDKTAPVIKLASSDDIYVCPGKKYAGEDFSALDFYDGDITDKVVIRESDDEITYSVKDSHGNKTSISRNIIYEDLEKPTITLNGSDVVYAFLGEEYKDLGVTVTDNCDNLTKKVVTSGEVDVFTPGSYDVTYKVSDVAGNVASVKRTVIVSERGKNGTIYLTFDDGPKWGTTDVILDILKEEGVEATFFVTNSGPDELIKRAFDDGHTIGLHTASHNYSVVYASVDSYFQDLDIVSQRVKNITGQESKIIRFPGGASNTISRRYSSGIMSLLTVEVLNRGYRYYDWNISSGDAAVPAPTADQIFNNVVNNLSKNRVNMVLMHDIKPYTRDALRNIIQYAKREGYTFEKITTKTEMITQRVNN